MNQFLHSLWVWRVNGYLDSEGDNNHMYLPHTQYSLCPKHITWRFETGAAPERTITDLQITIKDKRVAL